VRPGAERLGALAIAACAIVLPSCTPTLSQPRGEEHLDAMATAGRHYHHGRMEEAAAWYGRAAEHAERRVDLDEALYRQAKSLERIGENRRAIAILDRVAERRPPSRRTARALFDASLLRLEIGERDAGLAGLRRLLLEDPGAGNSSRALRVLLRDFRERDDATGALRFLQATYERVGGSELGDDLLAEEADLRLERGDRAGARRALERIVADHPYPHGQRWDDALWQLADLDVEDGDPRAAVGRLEELVSVHEHTDPPGSYTLDTMPRAQMRIARLHRDALDDPEAAVGAFREVYDEYPTCTLRDDALTELGEMLLGLGEREEACELFEGVVDEFEVGRARRRAAQHLETDCR